MSYYSHIPNWRDKIPCSLFYFGVFLPYVSWVPLIWILVAGMRQIQLKDYVRYHCYQAILFNMIAGFIPRFLSILVGFLANLLSLLAIFENSANLLVHATGDLIWIYWIFIRLVAIYAVLWSLRGRFTYLPPISQAVNLLLR